MDNIEGSVMDNIEGSRHSMSSKVIVRDVRNKPLIHTVQDALEQLEIDSLIPSRGKVVVKLNLNTADPHLVASADTDPRLVDAFCKTILDYTKDVTLVEAHGYRHSAEEAFKVTGIDKIAKRLGVKILNLSNAPCRDVGNDLLGPLPNILLEADLFVTMPVLKTHALTYFTGALKNQWGCIPRYDRIALHQYLDELIVELNRILKPRLCVMDGIIGVEGRGPTNGKPRRLDIILASTDPVALDATAMRLVGLDPTKARHVVLAHKAGLGAFNPEDIAVVSDVTRTWEPFEPARLDWAVYLMNRLTKYRWFRKYILEVRPVFYSGKRIVSFLRRLGLVR